MKSEYTQSISGPSILNRDKVIKSFENLKAIHGKYGVKMHEIQMMDGRMNLITLLTSTIDKYAPGMKGANIANYVEFQDFLKDEYGKVIGAVVYDRLKNK